MTVESIYVSRDVHASILKLCVLQCVIIFNVVELLCDSFVLF